MDLSSRGNYFYNESVPKSQKRSVKAAAKPTNSFKFYILSTILLILLAGGYIWRSVLPYYLSAQWQPTNDNLNLTGAYDPTHLQGEFMGRLVRSVQLPQVTPPKTAVLGETDPSNKRIEVDLAQQKVFAYEGDAKVMEFTISSGKWGRTPTGNFRIAYKTKAQTMSGGSKALRTYYYLPNVQYVQFFGNDEIPWSKGFSFHGTYWHNNFGTPMSHGCINMRNEDAQQLFYWTTPDIGTSGTIKVKSPDEGTPVFIFGEAPRS